MEKTGGTSIVRSIWGHERPVSADKTYDGGLTKHYSVEKARSMTTPYKWNRYLRFTVVRNPWDRLVSKWWWRRGGLAAKGQALPGTLQLTANGKIPMEWFCEEFEEERQRWNLTSDTPTDEFLFGQGDDPQVSEILRFESLQQDWGKLLDKYPDKFRGCKRELPHCNKSVNRDWDYRLYYTNETTQLVAESCPKLIYYFNYTFSDS